MLFYFSNLGQNVEQSKLRLDKQNAIYYGDNLPVTDELPEIYEWTRRLHLMRRWAEMLNALGGDVTVIHLPEIGLHGNTHFPMSDLNNVAVADHLSAWLHEKMLN